MTFWNLVFAASAVFTLGAGLPFLLAPGVDSLGIGYADTPQTRLMIRMVGLLITVFGIGYAFAALNPVANRVIAWLGVIGKSATVVLLTSAYAAGTIPIPAFVLGLGDVVFVGLFAVFLWKTSAATTSAGT